MKCIYQNKNSHAHQQATTLVQGQDSVSLITTPLPPPPPFYYGISCKQKEGTLLTVSTPHSTVVIGDGHKVVDSLPVTGLDHIRGHV
jgi:hypothetical protein